MKDIRTISIVLRVGIGFIVSVICIVQNLAYRETPSEKTAYKAGVEGNSGAPMGVPGGILQSNVVVNTTEARESAVPKLKEPDFDADEERSIDIMVTQIPPRAVSRTSWNPPNVEFSGVVEVRVTVDADGSHTEEMSRNTGVPELDSYLKAFFAGWRWEPGKVDGKPINTTKLVRFRID